MTAQKTISEALKELKEHQPSKANFRALYALKKRTEKEGSKEQVNSISNLMIERFRLVSPDSEWTKGLYFYQGKHWTVLGVLEGGILLLKVPRHHSRLDDFSTN